MTQPEQKSRNKAAVFFIGFMALALGGLGVVLAALAVGTERAWTGGAESRRTGRESAREGHRQWLEADAAAREAWRGEHREWVRQGSKPEARPAGPSRPSRFARGLRRLWAHVALASGDFADGWRAGWKSANEERRKGGRFGKTFRARNDWRQPPPENTEDPGAAPTPAPCIRCFKPTELVDAAGQPDCGCSKAFEEREPEPTEPLAEESKPSTGPAEPQPEQEKPERPAESAPSPNGNTDAPPIPHTTSSNGGSPVATETNLDLTVVDLQAINTCIGRINDKVDALAQERAQLSALVQVATERAGDDAPAATRQALDSANTVVTHLGQHLGVVSENAAQATEDVNAAREGLRPAQEAQDTLHSSGARGEFVSAARP